MRQCTDPSVDLQMLGELELCPFHARPPYGAILSKPSLHRHSVHNLILSTTSIIPPSVPLDTIVRLPVDPARRTCVSACRAGVGRHV